MMQHHLSTPTAVLGARLLKEVRDEEGSLEDLLQALRQACFPFHIPQTSRARTILTTLHSTLPPPHTNIISINSLPSPIPFLNFLISDLVTSQPLGTIALIDLTSRFALRPLTDLGLHLSHIHVWHPTTQNLAATLGDVERYMLWGQHESKGRIWAATVIIGETASAGLATQKEIGKLAGIMKKIGGFLVTVNWRGKIKAEMEERGGAVLGKGVSVEEAWSTALKKEKMLGLRKESESEETDIQDGGVGGWKITQDVGEGRL